MNAEPMFEFYIGIDYSGAETANSGLRGLRIYTADPNTPPTEVQLSGRRWTRRAVAEWLQTQLSGDGRTLVGIDHAFSFPIQYFERNDAPRDWTAFLKDFRHHWPTDNDHTYVDFVRDGITGNGEARSGNPRWRRLTEIRTRGAKSVFHFDVPGSVAKSTHAGLPWLLRIREHTGERVHFWPFDGWDIPPGRSVIAEVYPSLWNHSLTLHGFDPHQRDAYAIAAWMRTTDATGSLKQFFSPELERAEREIADVEGWILGVS